MVKSSPCFDKIHLTLICRVNACIERIQSLQSMLSNPTSVHQYLHKRVPSLIDKDGGVKLRMLHLSFSNLVLSLLRNIEVHGAMSETGASQPLNLLLDKSNMGRMNIIQLIKLLTTVKHGCSEYGYNKFTLL